MGFRRQSFKNSNKSSHYNSVISDGKSLKKDRYLERRETRNKQNKSFSSPLDAETCFKLSFEKMNPAPKRSKNLFNIGWFK